VLSDTSLGQYVFVPVASEYSRQTDHVSDTAVIHECQLVCLCLWHCCRLILVPPARLQPPSGPLSPPFSPFFPILQLWLANSDWTCPIIFLLGYSSSLLLFFLSLYFAVSFSSIFSSQFCLLHPPLPRLFVSNLSFFFFPPSVPMHQTRAALALNIVLIGFPVRSLTLL